MTFRGQTLSILPRGGLNNGDDPVNLDPNQSPDCLNVRFAQDGVYKRDGMERYLATAVNGSAAVVGIAQLTLANGTSEQIAVAGNDIMEESGGVWASIKGALTFTANQNNLQQFAQLTDLIVGTNNVDAIWRWGGTGNATALGGSPPGKAKGIAAYKNYLFLLNTEETGTRRPGRIRWSLLNNAENWPAANVNDLANNTGQAGQGLAKFGDQLFAFFDRSIYEVVYTGNSVTPFIFPTTCADIGSASGYGLVVTDDAVFFPSYRGIYAMNGGVPRYISEPIEGTWATINAGRLQYVVGVHNRAYNEVWFAISTGSNTAHDTILVYDYVRNAWTIFSGVTVNAFGQFSASLPLNPIVGTTSSLVLKANSGDYLDDTSAITAYIDTKPHPMGDPTRKRQVKRLQLICQSEDAAGAQHRLTYAYDLGSLAGETTVDVSHGGSLWDQAVWDVDVFAQGSRMIKYARPTGHGRFFQIRVRNIQASVGMKLADLIAWVNFEERKAA